MSWDPDQKPASPPSGAAALRPLSIGELFDRAFSLYARHILTFASILFVATIPYALIALMQLYLQRGILDAYASLLDAFLKHPSSPPDMTGVIDAVSKQNPATVLGSYALSGLTYLVLLFVLPLANAAVVSGVSRAYLGLPVRFRVCYQDAFKRWGHVLILTVLWAIVAIPVFFIVFFLFMLIVIGLVGVATVLHAVGAVLAIIVGVALVLAITGLAVMGYMAFASSFVACVLEKADPLRSFALGFSRIFGGGLFTRSLLVALAIAAVYAGFTGVAVVIALVTLALTKSFFLYFAIAQIINVVYVGFAFVVVSLYYYDVRIRREGFDIKVLADQLAAPPA